MVDKPIVIFSYIVLYLYSYFVICLYNYMSILNSNSLCINAFLLQRLPISVERVRWKVCSLFVFSVVSLLLSSWWWYFLFLVLPSLLNPFVLKFYSSEQNPDVCSFMFQCQGAVWFQGTFFCVMFWHLRANLILCIDVALRYLKPVVKSVVLMRSANFYNPVNNHFTLQS